MRGGHAFSVYRWIDHTAELELEIEAPTARDVLSAAAAALAELLGEGGEAAGTSVVSVAARDRAGVLAEFMEEIVFLAETESCVPTGVDVVQFDEESAEWRLRARVHLARGNPPHLVKAVTYHGLAFEPDDDGWRATAVLDV